MTTAGLVAVYGATGYTGRLVAHELRRRGMEVVLSGRSEERLRAVAEELGARVAPAAADDPAALRRAFADAAVVVSCAGPFGPIGDAVVEAAVDVGAHYADTTGEQPFIHRVFERHGAAAAAAGVALVPGLGYDHAPGDLLCAVAARGHQPAREVVVAYAVSNFSATRGTLRSTVETARGGGLEYEDGVWRPAPAGPLRAHFTFPPPIGRLRMLRYPGGEVVTVPRHVRCRRVRALISANAIGPGDRAAHLVPLLAPGLRAALVPPVRRAIERAIERLPEGPSEAERRRATFTVVALAEGEDGSAGQGLLTGRDVYGSTAACVAEGALRLAAPGFEPAGALAPATAFDAESFLAALAPAEIAFEIHHRTAPGGPPA